MQSPKQLFSLAFVSCTLKYKKKQVCFLLPGNSQDPEPGRRLDCQPVRIRLGAGPAGPDLPRTLDDPDTDPADQRVPGGQAHPSPPANARGQVLPVLLRQGEGGGGDGL